MPFIIQEKSNIKYLSIVVVLAVLAAAGIFLYQQNLNKKSIDSLAQEQQQVRQTQTTNGSSAGQGQASFTCGISTVAGAGGLTHGTVVGPDGKCWMDRNLGATQVAASSTDANAYGYYYQWGRAGDGHQLSNSATTSINADSDTPGHANFIIESDSPYDWRVPQSPNEATLWAGANGGSNNPCPAGWHVPTRSEWVTVAGYFSPQTSVGAFNSTLKLSLAGFRVNFGVGLDARGSYGLYWSSSPSGTDTSYLNFSSEGVSPEATNPRAFGGSVRCVKD